MHASNHFGGCFSSVETEFSFVVDALIVVDLGNAADAARPYQQSTETTMRMLMRVRDLAFMAVILCECFNRKKCVDACSSIYLRVFGK